jgi:hypothetical protein
MNIRRVLLDVDAGRGGASVEEIGDAIAHVAGVEALNITVTEIDQQTLGMDVTIEGNLLDLPGLTRAIEKTGAVVHSVDELVAGDRLVEHVTRRR